MVGLDLLDGLDPMGCQQRKSDLSIVATQSRVALQKHSLSSLLCLLCTFYLTSCSTCLSCLPRYLLVDSHRQSLCGRAYLVGEDWRGVSRLDILTQNTCPRSTFQQFSSRHTNPLAIRLFKLERLNDNIDAARQHER